MKLSTILMPGDLSSNLSTIYDKKVFRIVEAQHMPATLHIADNIQDQLILEQILEETKPKVPTLVKDLPYLLSTPFRYEAVKGATIYDNGSRFRRAGSRDGVFYCSESPNTCAMEAAFYRALFLNESPGLEPPSSSLLFSSFSTTISSERVLDLTSHPKLLPYSSLWEHLSDYEACQELAEHARHEGVEIIAYRSVRDPQKGINYAILSPEAFHSKTVGEDASWSCTMNRSAIFMRREFPLLTLELKYSDLANDNRFRATST